MNSEELHIGVVGAGAWGTALAILTNRSGSKATLWARNPLVAESIEKRRINAVHLPEIFIDPAIGVVRELTTLTTCDILILAVPAQSLRTVCIALSDLVDATTPLVIATKGIERGSLMLMSEVVQSILPQNPQAILSGPNFAAEAARGLPTASALATHHPHLAEQITFAMGGKFFRIYGNDDPIGTQIGGAVKNVLAIAAGITIGRSLGENARAALISRGMAEIIRLTRAKGGQEETLMGLAGFGDVLLSCTSAASRNYALGHAIGRGTALAELLHAGKTGLTEGVATAESVTALAQKLGVRMPIAETVRDILAASLPVDGAIERLLERPMARE
ncbi:MAG: NAD(P)H-dependent glycerol-3-phosphate dehydrogenase [Alphaproteobacteria bacterium]